MSNVHAPARINHTAICVIDIAKAAAFYEGLFGLTQVSTWSRPEIGLIGVLLADTSGNRLEIVENALNAVPLLEGEFCTYGLNAVGIRHIAFSVASVDYSFTRALELGGKALSSPCAGKAVKRMAFVADLDGIQLELIEAF